MSADGRGGHRGSLVLVGLVAVVGTAVAWRFREHVTTRWEDADPLLWGCWIAMLLLVAPGASRRDVPLAFVGLAGGVLIESWGTRAGLWTYFTGEQPPAFILPAWPMAALASHRIAALFEARRSFATLVSAVPYWIGSLGFLGLLLGWTLPGISHPLTWLAWLGIVLTIVLGDDRRADLRLFLAGTLVGFPLELWGTRHGCWAYWDGGAPPVASVLSHGFATVAFSRGVALLSSRSSARSMSPGEEVPS